MNKTAEIDSNGDRTIDWALAKEIFADAMEVGEPDRAAFVAESCAGDAGLLDAVEGLLRSIETAVDFFSDPAEKQ